MVVATARHRNLGVPPAPSCVAPEASPRLGAHGWPGKRVREDVRDGVAVAAFSLAASTGVSVAIFLAVRLAG